MSKEPYVSPEDHRLQQNREVLAFFQSWEQQTRTLEMNRTEQNRCLLTRECREDIECMISSFEEYVISKSKRSKVGHVHAHRMNTDISENIFCSQRSFCHGATTNPTALQYQKALNAIILCQPNISPKSNAPKSYTKPFAFANYKPLRHWANNDAVINVIELCCKIIMTSYQYVNS